jgi:hypothetical protein
MDVRRISLIIAHRPLGSWCKSVPRVASGRLRAYDFDIPDWHPFAVCVAFCCVRGFCSLPLVNFLLLRVDLVLVFRARRKLNPDPLYVCAEILERAGYLDGGIVDVGDSVADAVDHANPAGGAKIRKAVSRQSLHLHSEKFEEMNKNDDVQDGNFQPVKITPRMLAIARDTLKMKIAMVQWEKECELKLKKSEDDRTKAIIDEEQGRKRSLSDQQTKSAFTHFQISIADCLQSMRVKGGRITEWKLVFKEEAIAFEALSEVRANLG